jgi:hypothetical protein
VVANGGLLAVIDVQLQNLRVWFLAYGFRATIQGYMPFAVLRSRYALAS